MKTLLRDILTIGLLAIGAALAGAGLVAVLGLDPVGLLLAGTVTLLVSVGASVFYRQLTHHAITRIDRETGGIRARVRLVYQGEDGAVTPIDPLTEEPILQLLLADRCARTELRKLS